MAQQNPPSPFMKFFWTLLLLVVAVPLVHLFFVLHVWEDGVATLNHNLQEEIGLLDLGDNPSAYDFVSEAIQKAYYFIYTFSGLEEAANGGGKFGEILVKNWNIVQGLILSAQLIGLRISVMVLAIPFFILILCVAISDGIYAWLIRRSGAERESAFIYHRTKRGFMAGIMGIIFIYLIPPVVMDPKYVFPPFILLSAMAVRMTIKYFKKYI